MFRVTRYPMISKTESGRVSKEIPGSGSGSGTRWALMLVPSKMSWCFLYGWADTNFPGVSNIPSHRSHLILWKFGCCSPLSQFLVQTSFCREVGFGIFLWCSKAKFHTSPFRQRMFVINTTIWVVFEPHSTKNTFFSGNWLQTEILKH